MRKSIWSLCLMLLPLLWASPVKANEAFHGWCELGNQSVVTSGLSSTTKVQQSNPQCTVTVFVHGGGLATLFADNNGTPLANPFQSQTNGQIIFYAANGRYDISMQPGTTYLDWLLCDPFAIGSTCNNGGTVQAHNLLSTTHLDTIPASPPVRGDLVTAQNQTSPSGINPAWARLPLGTSGQVLLSNGVDALWGSLTAGSGITITNNTGSLTISSSGGGSGCTLPGVTDTAVVSEHPVGTCYDSIDWTWDDTNQNMLQGDGTNHVHNTVSMTFSQGTGNSQTFTSRSWAIGDGNTHTCDANTVGTANCYDFFDIGRANSITVTGASSEGFFHFVYGEGNIITVTGGSQGSDLLQLLRANTISSLLTGDVDDVVQMGKGNNLQATGANSVTSSAFQIGENDSVLTSAGGDFEDNFQLGENSVIQATASGSGGGFITQIGFNHSFTTSTTSVQMNYGFAMGHLNTTSDGSGATANMTDFGMIGHSLHILNCSDCYAIGKNIDQSGINNTLFLGMSASDIGLVITNSGGTHDNVRRTPMVFASLPACAAGTEGSFAAITDSTTAVWGATITGSSTNHVLGYCDGTQWTVAGK